MLSGSAGAVGAEPFWEFARVGRTPWSAAGPLAGFSRPTKHRALFAKADEGVGRGPGGSAPPCRLGREPAFPSSVKPPGPGETLACLLYCRRIKIRPCCIGKKSRTR